MKENTKKDEKIVETTTNGEPITAAETYGKEALSLELAGIVAWDEAEMTKPNGKTEKIRFLSFKVRAPFKGDEDKEFTIKALSDAQRGILKYRSEKALKTEPEIPFKAFAVSAQYRDKKSRKVVDYYPITMKSPFPEDGGKEIRCSIPNNEQRGVFNFLFKNHFGLEDKPDDIQLNS